MGFEGVGHLVKLEVHELLGVLGLEDLHDLPLCICFNTFSFFY